MSFSSTPERGDIVIRPGVRNNRRVWVVHSVPGPSRYVLPTRDGAVDRAIHLARRQHVCAWIDATDTQLTPIENFRTDERPPRTWVARILGSS